MSISLDEAYAECEAIARREAKNFYYAFRVLPKPKRAAICAVYAFMRHADDLADDERLPRDQRLQKTERWLQQWHRAAAGEPSNHAVFVALRDTQQRFAISTDLLDQLVQGTTLDLRAPADAVVYETFDDLYRYCYLVASVVGLVCIRIFGYADSRAEKLAEETGIAFQLTNILRDVREDAEHRRLYLPLEDLRRHKITLEPIASFSVTRKLTPDERALMKMEADRARGYYAAADRLLPLIAPDSRAALWVLVRIYRRLLDRIQATNYEVLSTRVRVSSLEKTFILIRGLWMAFRLRVGRGK